MKKLNRDFSLTAFSHTADQLWLTSPADGASRISLKKSLKKAGTQAILYYLKQVPAFLNTHFFGEEIFKRD